MDGTVTYVQDVCGNCKNFGNGCAVTNPDSPVQNCNEWRQKGAVTITHPYSAEEKPELCRSCIHKNEDCIPNVFDDCPNYISVYNKEPPDSDEVVTITHPYSAEEKPEVKVTSASTKPDKENPNVLIKQYSLHDGLSYMKASDEYKDLFPNDQTPNEDDHVNHPSHYTQGGIECIDAIRASMPLEGFQDYCKGNVLKYIWRWRDKGGVEDLEKAQVYLFWLIDSAEKDSTNE